MRFNPFLSCSIVISATLIFVIAGCQEYEEDFTILRFPIIEADVDSLKWSTRQYTVVNIGKVVQHPDSAQESNIVYDRLVLTGFTNENDVEKLQIVFDIADIDQLAGIYTPKYSELGRLVHAEWVTATSSEESTYATYSLCELETGQLKIERQNRAEDIFSGSFSFTACQKNAAENTLRFTNGKFRDLEYN